MKIKNSYKNKFKASVAKKKKSDFALKASLKLLKAKDGVAVPEWPG